MPVHSGHRDRKRQQFLRNGADPFADHELLELLLYSAIPRRDTNPIAHALMDRFGSISGVCSASVEELTEVPGVGEKTALFLRLAPRLYDLSRQKAAENQEFLRDVEDISRYFLAHQPDTEEECTYLACLDATGRVLSLQRFCAGPLPYDVQTTRRIVEQVLRCSATAVAFAQYCPHPAPGSRGLNSFTVSSILQALEGVDIIFADYVYISPRGVRSFKRSYYLL